MHRKRISFIIIHTELKSVVAQFLSENKKKHMARKKTQNYFFKKKGYAKLLREWETKYPKE